MGNRDIVIENPPYSHKYSASDTLKLDPRFSKYPLAPKSKADYMFLLDGLAQLSENGTMAILLPHGVLFRGGSEEKIRKQLVEEQKIHAIIGLPEKLFSSTDIPTVAIIIRNKPSKDLLFIDAQKEFKQVGKRNVLQLENIYKILNTYRNRMDVDKFSHLASLEEIRKNDYNLNIPRYVDTYEPPEPVDLEKLNQEILEIDIEQKKSLEGFYDMFKNLVGNSAEANKRLKKQEEIIKNLIKITEENIKASALDIEAWKAAEKKTKTPHLEEDGIPSKEYQQVTIDMLTRSRQRIEQTERVMKVVQELKQEFLNEMFV